MGSFLLQSFLSLLQGRPEAKAGKEGPDVREEAGLAVGFCGLQRTGLGQPRRRRDRTEVLIPRPKLQHQREASAPSPCTPSRFSRQRSCKGRVKNSSSAWSDQSPVTGAQGLPSLLRLSWKPRLTGSRLQWVPPWPLGPCPPIPPITLAPPPAQAPAKQGQATAQGQGGVKQSSSPWPGLSPWKDGWWGGYNFFGLRSGWGLLKGVKGFIL